MPTLDSRTFLKKVLRLREMYDISYIFNTIKCMGQSDLQDFARADDEEIFWIFERSLGDEEDYDDEDVD